MVAATGVKIMIAAARAGDCTVEHRPYGLVRNAWISGSTLDEVIGSRVRDCLEPSLSQYTMMT